MAHEVVSQVQVGDVLAVKQTFRHLLQAVTGQVNHADCLRNHLHKHTRHQKGNQKKTSDQLRENFNPKSERQADTSLNVRWTNRRQEQLSLITKATNITSLRQGLCPTLYPEEFRDRQR